MKLLDLFPAERIVVPLQADTTRSAAQLLVDQLVRGGAIPDPAKLLSRTEEERGEDVVAMGDRVVLVHYRTDAVADVVAAMGVAPTPIRREGGPPDAPGARIAVVLIASPRRAARFLQVLSALARVFASADVVAEILAAGSPDAVRGVPALATADLPEHLSVRDVMTDHPRRTTPDAMLREAAADMVRAGVAALPVVDDEGLLVGMLTEKDLMRHLVAGSLQTAGPHRPTPVPGTDLRRRVRDVMTRQVLCVSPEQPLAEVAALMTNKDVDRVPVVREGRLVGFLSRGDIIRKLVGS